MKNLVFHISWAICFILSILSLQVNAQVPSDSIQHQVTSDSSHTNTEVLPFFISDVKKLSDEDLQNKKEGTYITGAPELSSDPLNGFGYGLEGSIYFNGKKTDPFFAYTPYRRKIDVTLFNTTKSQREIKVALDIPYIFNTKWRLRMEGAYEVNPNLVYFGTTEKSLNGLSYYPNGDSSSTPVNNASYKDYINSLTGPNQHYNQYIKQEAIYNISVERSIMDSKARVLGGFEVADVNIKTFSGNSLARNDQNSGKILGVGNNLITILQGGFVYDTRDLETDPNKGIFAEVTNELSLKALGSAFNFNKTFVQAKFYQPILPSVFKKVIFASRLGMGYTAGGAPFYEYQDQWSSEGSIEGLGGGNTLRGYKQSRFLGRVMNFANFELRCRFYQTTIFKQHLAFSAVPLFDIGGVWDNFKNFTTEFQNYRYSEGMGLRIVWNVNTVLRFDYAVSKEDGQFFFSLGHAF